MMTLTDKILVIAMIVVSAAISIAMLYWLANMALMVWELL
jgi:hypothetical protein